MDGQKIFPEEVIIEKINKNHNFSSFVSYEKDLKDFLIEDALTNQELKLSTTFLWLYQQKLVSYITLLTDKINLEGDLQTFFRDKGIAYFSLPALKIGRLCVDDHFQRKGLGRMMLVFAAKKAQEICDDKAGCRFLTVDAKKDSILFYKKQGFEILKMRTDGTAVMYVDLLKFLP
ncbi:GNAT family N-acetyltransferase [Candidatus Woesearchaeota archaeon]|nr:GNAT family N-acetyltransferase [Candidatus Woesearchaeota archaeon]